MNKDVESNDLVKKEKGESSVAFRECHRGSELKCMNELTH